MPNYADTDFNLFSNSDYTKFFQITLSSLVTNTTVTWTLPEYSGRPVVTTSLEAGPQGSLLTSDATYSYWFSPSSQSVIATDSDGLLTTYSITSFPTGGGTYDRGIIPLFRNLDGTWEYLEPDTLGQILKLVENDGVNFPTWSSFASTELSDTSSLPRKNTTNTFTKAQTIQVDSDAKGLRIIAPAGAISNQFEFYSTDNSATLCYIASDGGFFAPYLGIQESGGSNTITVLNKSTISTSRIYKYDNTIASTDIALCGGTQTFSGAKTLSGASFFTGAGGANVDGTTSKFIFRDSTTTSKTFTFDISGFASSTHRKLKVSDTDGQTIVGVGNGGSAPSSGLGSLALTAQTAAIAATNLTNSSPAGFYEVAYYLETTTANAGDGSIGFQVNYTDRVGATNQSVSGLLLTATTTGATALKGTFTLYLASGNITYQTNLTGAQTTSRYSVDVKVKYLG